VTGTIFLEDLHPGRCFAAGPVPITAEQITRFAAEYDPQPFHLDDAAASGHPVFQGLAASGWHTAALTMRLVTQALDGLAHGIIGAGGDLQWPRPVRPGDALRVEIEVLEVVPSRSRPDRGFATIRIRTLNQAGEEVQVFTPKTLVWRRPAGG
jgi:acyl dehydratase